MIEDIDVEDWANVMKDFLLEIIGLNDQFHRSGELDCDEDNLYWSFIKKHVI